MLRRTIIHRQNRRLYVNAGMSFPDCAANATLLDCDKARWSMTSNETQVTCRRCRRKKGDA